MEVEAFANELKSIYVDILRYDVLSHTHIHTHTHTHTHVHVQELSLQEGGTLSGGALSGGALSGGVGEYSREFPNLTPTQTEGVSKRPGATPEKKEGTNLRGSQRGGGGGGYEYGGSHGQKRNESGSYSRIQRGTDGNFMFSPSRSGGRGRSGDFGGYQTGFDRGPPRGGDIGSSGRSGRDHYGGGGGGGYPGGVRDHYRDGYGGYGDHDGYRGHHGSDYDRYSHTDWRRSYAGGEFDHLSPYGGPRGGPYGDIHGDHFRGSGRHGGSGRFGTRRNRLVEEARMFRAKSHERVDHMGGPGGARGPYRLEDDFRDTPDFYLSQPTTPHFPYDSRPPSFGMPPSGT